MEPLSTANAKSIDVQRGCFARATRPWDLVAPDARFLFVV